MEYCGKSTEAVNTYRYIVYLYIIVKANNDPLDLSAVLALGDFYVLW